MCSPYVCRWRRHRVSQQHWAPSNPHSQRLGKFAATFRPRGQGRCSGKKSCYSFNFMLILRYSHTTMNQVWPLTQYFSVSFLRKLIDLPGGQINDPSSGKQYSLPFLPATPSSPSWTLEGLFELTRCPSRAPTCLVSCFQNYRDTRTQSGVPR